jgi:hypothetical protein
MQTPTYIYLMMCCRPWTRFPSHAANPPSLSLSLSLSLLSLSSLSLFSLSSLSLYLSSLSLFSLSPSLSLSHTHTHTHCPLRLHATSRIGRLQVVARQLFANLMGPGPAHLPQLVEKLVGDEQKVEFTCALPWLQGKTKVLVTHQTFFLPEADLVVVMENGRVQAQGSFAALTNPTDPTHSHASPAAGLVRLLEADLASKDGSRATKLMPAEGKTEAEAGGEGSERGQSAESSAVGVGPEAKDKRSRDRKQLREEAVRHSIVQAETRQVGKVESWVWREYLLAFGGPLVVGSLVLLLLLGQANIVGVDTFLSFWSALEPREQEQPKYLWGLLALVLLMLAIAGLRAYLFLCKAISAADSLHGAASFLALNNCSNLN